jgi:FkbM family methyltransferase
MLTTFLKKLYKAVPFKKQLFSFIKIFGKPPQRIYRHLYFKGNFKIKITDEASIKIRHYGYELENEIFWSGLGRGWEKESMKIWISLCRESRVIFDIGANTGIYALVASAVNREAKVFAFEPVKRVFDKLVANNNLNDFNIHCFEAAVSNYSGEAVIYDQPAEHVYTVTVNKNILPGEVFPVKIKTITLKDIISMEALSEIDLIKIDVETHEAEVLEGLGECLKKFQPSMLIEILNEEVAINVGRLLSGMDYLYYNIDELSMPRKVSSLSKSDFYNFLVCKKQVAEKLGLAV